MSTLPEGLTQAEIDRYAKLDAGIKALEKERKALGDKMKKILAPGTYIFENVVVERGEAVGLDSKTFVPAFPASEYPQYYKPVPDTEAIPETIRAEHFVVTQRLSVKTVD